MKRDDQLTQTVRQARCRYYDSCLWVPWHWSQSFPAGRPEIWLSARSQHQRINMITQWSADCSKQGWKNLVFLK